MSREARPADALVEAALAASTDPVAMLELLALSRDTLSREHAMVRLPPARLMVVGDLHGHLGAAAWVARELLARPECHLVALGDYVDRGTDQLATLALVLGLLVAEPGRVTLLRGNHESPEMNARYGFEEEVLSLGGRAVLDDCHDTFAQMPVAALRTDGVLCLHGGIPSSARSLDDIAGLPKGGREPSDPDLLELLWNDPDEGPGAFGPNMDRGIGHTFGAAATEAFMRRSGLWLLMRAHEPFPEGYEWFHGGRVLSVFSHPGYFGRNDGAVALVGTDRKVEVITIAPPG